MICPLCLTLLVVLSFVVLITWRWGRLRRQDIARGWKSWPIINFPKLSSETIKLWMATTCEQDFKCFFYHSPLSFSSWAVRWWAVPFGPTSQITLKTLKMVHKTLPKRPKVVQNTIFHKMPLKHFATVMQQVFKTTKWAIWGWGIFMDLFQKDYFI